MNRYLKMLGIALMRSALVLAILVMIGLSKSDAAGIPNSYTYNGVLRQAGVPANGTFSMTFNIRNGSGGSVLWTSGAQNVTVSSGSFSYNLVPTGVNWTLPTVTPYIEAVVEGNSLSPQEQIGAVPFAFVSSMAVNLNAMNNPHVNVSTNIRVTCLSIGNLNCNPSSDNVLIKIGRNDYANTHSVLNTKVYLGASIAPEYQGTVNMSAYDNTYPVVYVKNTHDAGNLMELESPDAVTNSAATFLALKKNGAYVGSWLLNGRLGIGTLAPSAMLHVFQPAGTTGTQMIVSTGTTKLFEVAGASVSSRVNFYALADALKAGGGSWTDSSDIRLKEKIVDLANPLETLLSLHGVQYHWKKDQPNNIPRPTTPQTGFIAQEVEKVKPEWIGTDEKGYKTLTIRGFEAMAVEAIRELNTKVEALAAENKQLKSQLSSLLVEKGKRAKLIQGGSE